MQEMQIYGVSFDLVGKQPIVLLKTAEGNKFLPIWIGHPEAAAILMKLQSASTPRPMTHDLVTDMLDQLGAQVTRITVTELRENTFYAQITVQLDGSEIDVDSRPSDAIALAIRADAPIFAADEVIEESAIEFEGGGHRGRDRVQGLRVQAVPRPGHPRRVRRRTRRRVIRAKAALSRESRIAASRGTCAGRARALLQAVLGESSLPSVRLRVRRLRSSYPPASVVVGVVRFSPTANLSSSPRLAAPHVS